MINLYIKISNAIANICMMFRDKIQNKVITDTTGGLAPDNDIIGGLAPDNDIIGGITLMNKKR